MKRLLTILFTIISINALGGEFTDVEEVPAADFAIEGGMVYSAGVITVYNVLGQVVAKAYQEFNANALHSSGFYAIVAEEGTIKFVK